MNPRVKWLKQATIDSGTEKFSWEAVEPCGPLSRWLDEKAEFHDSFGTLLCWYYAYRETASDQACLHLIFEKAAVRYVSINEGGGELVAHVYHP